MQHAIGDLALLADGRTAALLDPAGGVAWLCWPRVDSAPLLRQLLDARGGGIFSLRPVRPDARVVSRRYHPGSLVSETLWTVGRSRVAVDDALLLDSGSPQLARRVSCEGDAVEMEVRFRVADDANRSAVEVRCPGMWAERNGVRVARFPVGPSPQFALLHEPSAPAGASDAVALTISAWQQRSPDARALRLPDVVSSAMPESDLRASLVTTACVLLGLRNREGGIVAAPTTSLPQWPGATRNWDYRFCWLRDGALAATALLRLGLVDDARALAAFLGHVAERDQPPALVRVDGTPPPEEHILGELDGYRGARPVRIGNAAAKQLQLDIAGELTQLARALAGADALPESLAAACARVAPWAAERWRDPDHGIWEIRGAPRHYTYSRVMAWTALRDAAVLAESGRISGDATAWHGAARAIHERVLRNVVGPLQLTDAGGGPDAALACLPLVGFLRADHLVVTDTLSAITRDLDRGGLLDRCLPEQEAFADPCGPFIFPTFWMASALERSGHSGRRYFDAALACRSPLGLWGEVADPDTHAPLGNYPQVQSHASFVLAATAG